MQLEHDTIKGGDQLAQLEVGLEPLALRQSLFPLTLQAHKLLSLVVHQRQLSRTPVRSLAEALHLNGLQADLLIQAAQLGIHAFQVRQQAIPVIKSRQHLAPRDRIPFIHPEGSHPRRPRHSGVGSRQVTDVSGRLKLPQGGHRFRTNRTFWRRRDGLGIGRRPQQPATNRRDHQTSSQNRPALGGHQSSGGLSNRSMSM